MWIHEEPLLEYDSWRWLIVTSSTPDSATLLQLLAQRDAEIRAKDLLIEKLKLQLANLRRHRFGSKSEALD